MKGTVRTNKTTPDASGTAATAGEPNPEASTPLPPVSRRALESLLWEYAGLERSGAAYARGALITRELPNTRDLSELADNNDPLLKDRAWVDGVSRQLARCTRIMHDHRFTHNDLKWRNLLIDDQAKLYLIDCPNGDFWRGFWLKYRITKDLACLDKVAKYHLTATQRLRFYFQYTGRNTLNAADKERVRHIVRFFEGRE